MSIEQLAGALLEAVGADAARKEAWRKSGAAFFRGGVARASQSTRGNAGGASASGAGAQPPSGKTGAACYAGVAGAAPRTTASAYRAWRARFHDPSHRAPRRH